MKTMMIICSMLMLSFMASLSMSAHLVEKQMVYRAVETTEDVVEEVVEGPLVSNDIPVEIVEITETEEVIEEPFVSNDGSYESTEIIVIEEVSEKPPVVVAENEKPSEGSSWWWWPF